MTIGGGLSRSRSPPDAIEIPPNLDRSDVPSVSGGKALSASAPVATARGNYVLFWPFTIHDSLYSKHDLLLHYMIRS